MKISSQTYIDRVSKINEEAIKTSKSTEFTIIQYLCSDRLINTTCGVCGCSWKNMKTYIISSGKRLDGDQVNSEVIISEQEIHHITVHHRAVGKVTDRELVALGLL